jgi:hypothetical protein
MIFLTKKSFLHKGFQQEDSFHDFYMSLGQACKEVSTFRKKSRKTSSSGFFKGSLAFLAT